MVQDEDPVFREPVPLGCELEEFFIFSSPEGRTGWLEGAGVGYFPPTPPFS